LIPFSDTERKASTVSHVDHQSRPAKAISRRERRAFTDEFKAGAVRLVLDEGKTIPQVARDLDLDRASALRTWVERGRADRTKGKTGLTTAEREELAKLRMEVRELRMERDIPKEAAVGAHAHAGTGAFSSSYRCARGRQNPRSAPCRGRLMSEAS
jgi:transposase